MSWRIMCKWFMILWAVGLTASTSIAAGVPADLVLTNAKIYTADATRSMAAAVAVRSGRIVYVGSSAGAHQYIGPGTRVEDLHGQLVLPGLIDSHVHPS